MIEPARYNVTIRRGVTFERTLTFHNPDNSLIDWTGWTAAFIVRDHVGAVLANYSANVTLGGVAGTVAITLSPVVTAAILWAGGEYTLVLTAPGGTRADCWLLGNVDVQ